MGIRYLGERQGENLMTAPERIFKGLYWDEAWSLVGGCTAVSEGCDNCWSAKETHMRANNPNEKVKARNEGLTDSGCFDGIVRLNHEFLYKPLRKTKPTVYAVWNDLFHEDVPDEFRDQAFAVMLACHIWNNVPGHRFLILTKRAIRMAEYFSAGTEALLKRWANAGDGWLICNDPDVLFSELVYSATCHDWDESGRNSNGGPYKPWGHLDQLWPLHNLWLGVTAENQARADERIPILLQIPAAVRFVSVEPMLGAVDITKYLSCPAPTSYRILSRYYGPNGFDPSGTQPEKTTMHGLDWVICGGESGPGARPMHPDWARNLRDQCQEAGVPYFFKQWGQWYPDKKGIYSAPSMIFGDTVVHNIGKKAAGRLLDGREYNEFPEVDRP